MTATYNGLTFDTPLLAQWAAFFDLAGWDWSTGLARVGNWKPDFRATFGCSHSECGGSHTILISVLAIGDLDGVKGHPALEHAFGMRTSLTYPADAGAVFGLNPQVSTWVMSHGSGGGTESVPEWVDDFDDLWRKASMRVSGDS